MPAVIGIEGLRELNAAFARVSSEVKKDNVAQLREAAEPARVKAEQFALGNIGNMTTPWSRMRLGVTSRSVYVAPKSRRAGGSPRRNLGSLLLNQAMWPAVQESSEEITVRLEHWLDGVGAHAGF